LIKEEVIKSFNIKDGEKILLEKLLIDLKKTNKHTNLVGESTMLNPWDRHICDSIQLAPIIKKKESRILDMGTGPGFPGLVLAIIGYTNITLVDSKKKKIDFLDKIIKKFDLKTKAVHGRLESTKLKPFEFIVSRALAPLEKLLNYSLLFSNKNTTLLFLKGKNVMNEITEAKKNFYFNHNTINSQSSGGGYVVKIKNFKKI
jgi:16S rRNA (guanine527-N7)-methyltransferase